MYVCTYHSTGDAISFFCRLFSCRGKGPRTNEGRVMTRTNEPGLLTTGRVCTYVYTFLSARHKSNTLSITIGRGRGISNLEHVNLSNHSIWVVELPVNLWMWCEIQVRQNTHTKKTVDSEGEREKKKKKKKNFSRDLFCPGSGAIKIRILRRIRLEAELGNSGLVHR